MIDTVNDLDNVLYEVSNESGSPSSDSWQANVISFVKQYEATKPKQHPVGMTFQWKGGSDLTLYRSAADWISAGGHVPPSDGAKVIINDTDHAYGPGEMNTAVRPVNARGYGRILLQVTTWPSWTLIWSSGVEETFPEGTTADPRIGVKPDNLYAPIRDAMGMTLTYANRMNLVAMTPQPSLCSTHFCLVSPGKEYLVYQPYAATLYREP